MDLIECNETKYRHPWELSRTSILIKNLKDIMIHGDVLDIGCGDAYFDEQLLAKFERVNSLYGIDINLKEPFEKGKSHYFNDYKDIEGKKFDYILLMDVLEHIPDDITFLDEIKRYLKDNGKIIITVPAFQFLFGEHDKNLKHYRRYSHKELKNILEYNNLNILHSTYFYVSLFMVRAFTKNKQLEMSDYKYDEKSMVTKTLKNILNIDYSVLNLLSKIGIRLPGLSLLAIVNLQ